MRAEVAESVCKADDPGRVDRQRQHLVQPCREIVGSSGHPGSTRAADCRRKASKESVDDGRASSTTLINSAAAAFQRTSGRDDQGDWLSWRRRASRGVAVARVVVDVVLKPEILDPQGQAILGALGRLGIDGVKSVRQGKHFELDIDDGVDDEAITKLADTLLANPVIEDFTIRR
jgi:phosphoribosylformylglycinamidine synthase PurS subunit